MKIKRIILLLLAIILTACSSGAKSDYDANLKKWRDSGIDHYRFNLSISCFCPFMDVMHLTIEVQGGEVVSMTTVAGTPVTKSDIQYEFFTRYATIDRIFTELEAGLNGGADEVIVTYNPVHGFPQQVSVDMIKQAIDDEISLAVLDFESLP